MTFDPYGDSPSKEDLKKAGADDWFSDALAQQKKKDAALLAALGGESKSLKKQQQELQNLLEIPPSQEIDEETLTFSPWREPRQRRRTPLWPVFSEISKRAAGPNGSGSRSFSNLNISKSVAAVHVMETERQRKRNNRRLKYRYSKQEFQLKKRIGPTVQTILTVLSQGRPAQPPLFFLSQKRTFRLLGTASTQKGVVPGQASPSSCTCSAGSVSTSILEA